MNEKSSNPKGADITEEQALLRKQLRLLLKNIDEIAYDNKKYLLGRVLTVTDSIAADPDQRKAIKDLINEVFWPINYSNYDPYSETIKEFAAAQGIDQLYPAPTETNASLQAPQNQYENIK